MKKTEIVKTVFILFFIGVLFLSCKNDVEKTFKLTLSSGVKVVSPNDLNLDSVKEGITVTLEVTIPENKEVSSFTVNGEKNSLDANNQYDLTVSSDIDVAVSFENKVGFYSLSLSEGIDVVSPSGVDLNTIQGNTEITVEVTIPTNQAVDSFTFNGSLESLDESNRYTFNISEYTSIVVSFVNLVSLTLGENLELVSPTGLDLNSIPENTEVIIKIGIEDNKAFEDLYKDGLLMNIENPQYVFESGEIFINYTILLDSSFGLSVKYFDTLKIPQADKYEAVTGGVKLNQGIYAGNLLVPNCVTEIGASSFDGCSSLSSIEIPDSVISIGNRCFKGCSSLSSIDIPNNLSTIEEYTFLNCSSLVSVNIPDSVETINDYAFRTCPGLKSIFIPSNVSLIGESIFSDCGALNTINCGAESQPDGWDSHWKDGCSANVNWGQTRP